MPTIVTLNLRRDSARRDSPDDDPSTVPAFPEDVDLDQLTPRARALAEAIAQRPGQRIGEIVLQSDAAIADQLPDGDRYAWRRTSPLDAYGLDDWWQLRATDCRTAVQWLEIEARARVPLGWHVLGARRDTPVPSLLAGAADRHLTRDGVLDYMRARGAGMGIQAWDRFRGTGHTPEPDRYVQRAPQWHPETIDAYIDRPRERWTIAQVAEYLGIKPASARGQLSRWGITAATYEIGDSGRPEARFDADQVQAAYAHRPGRGARTDLHAT